MQSIEIKEQVGWPYNYGMALFVDGSPKHAVKGKLKSAMKVDLQVRNICAAMISKWATDHDIKITQEEILETLQKSEIRRPD